MVKPIIGQNKDGSYIYGEEPTKKTVAPIINTSTGLQNIGVPRFDTVQYQKIIPGKQFTPVEKKEIQASIDKQKQVTDSLKLNQRIDSNSERTKQLREHFDYLKNNNELFLNDKQTDYIKRFKIKYPDYQNVPDAILYGKVILTDPKTMDKYGNIGEKTFMQRLGNATYGNITALGDAVMEGVDAYKKYNVKDGGAMNEGVAVASGLGKFVGDTFTNVGANLLNLVTPQAYKLKGTTSTSELLGKNVGETLKGAGDIVSSGIDWMAGEGWTEETIKTLTEKVQNDPETMKEFEAAMNILNILPGGFAAKTEKALTAKQIIKNIAKDAELTLGKKGVFGTATKEALDVGMNKGLIDSVGTGINATLKASDDWIKKQTEILSRDIPETATAPSTFEKLKNASAEKIMSKQWKIKPNIRRDIRQKTGMSAEEFALSNNLVGKDVEESLARTNAFKDVKMSEKADIISEWGTAPKTPAQDAMAASLKKNLEGSLSDIAGANDPELVALLKGVDDFIKSEKTTYQQIDALKSLYDHYNPDNLSWDAQGRLVNPTAHQNAAYRRSEVQKMIEAEGEKRGVDIKQINKDIRGSHDLSRGLAAAEERMANNNIISLGDTQIAIMGSLLGGDIAGVGTLAVKKMLGSESATSFLARKLYNIPNDKVNPLTLSGGSRPIDRIGRFTGDNSPSTNIPSEVATPKEIIPIASSEGKSLAISAENKTLDVKKLLEKFEQLSPEEKAKAKMASPRLEELVKISTEIKDIQEFKGDFGYMPPEIVQSLGDNYLNYSPEAKELIRKGLDKEDLTILQKMNREKAGLPEPVVEEKVSKTEPTTTETIEEVVSTPEPKTPQEGKTALPMAQKSEVKYSEADEIGKYRDIPKGADNVPEYAQGLRAGGREYTIDGEKVYMNGGFENGGRDYIVQSFGVENKGKGVGTNAIKSILDKVFQNKGRTGYTQEFTVYAITPGAKGFWRKIADKFGGEMDDSSIPILKISRDNYLKSNK